jgi:small subunit ribosomal protein S19e
MTKFTVRDVSGADFIRAYADHLKKGGKLELPKYTEYIKTGCSRELNPIQDDWYYIRAAAIARIVYLKKGIGVGALQRHFGQRMRKGTRTEKFRKSSAGIIRTILQQLEATGTIIKCSTAAANATGQQESEFSHMKGREITSEGQRDLDRIAGGI